MPRYIDADEVLETMRSNMDMQELYLPTHFIDFVIENMPTADVQPVKQDTELSIILQDYGIKDTDTLRYILDQYQKIIVEITGGQMSYLTYPAQAVLDCTNDYYLSALADLKKEIMSREESDELLYGGYEEDRKTMIGSNE